MQVESSVCFCSMDTCFQFCLFKVNQSQSLCSVGCMELIRGCQKLKMQPITLVILVSTLYYLSCAEPCFHDILGNLMFFCLARLFPVCLVNNHDIYVTGKELKVATKFQKQ